MAVEVRLVFCWDRRSSWTEKNVDRCPEDDIKSCSVTRIVVLRVNEWSGTEYETQMTDRLVAGMVTGAGVGARRR